MAVNPKYAQQLIDLYNAANPDLPHPATVDDIEIYETPMEGGPSERFNTTSYLFAKEESKYFTGSMSIYYNRLNTNFNGDAFTDDIEKWQDDEYVLADMNRRLQETYPNDEFSASEMTIGRSEREDGTLVVLVAWPGSIKFAPPLNDNRVYEFVITPTVRDLSRLDGELDGFE